MFSLLVGAAVMSMLLNLYGGVRRKMTQEFRAYGANVVLAPGSTASVTHAQPLVSSPIEGVKKTGGPCHPERSEGSLQSVGGAGARRNNCRDSSPAKSGELRMTDSSSSTSPAADGNPGWARPESTAGSGVMDQSVMNIVEAFARQKQGTMAVPVLYGVVHLKRIPPDPRLPDFENVVAVGTDLAGISRMNPGWRGTQMAQALLPVPALRCAVGARIASRLRVGPSDSVYLEPLASPPAGRAEAGTTCSLASVLTTGSSEDDQVFLPLAELQKLMGMSGEISLVQMRLEGQTAEIERSIRELSKALPDLEVRPIRQIVHTEGRILGVIRWFLLSVTALILVIMVMCLMATMTAIALERRKDIGVMKALGASDLEVMRLFLAECGALGLVGGGAGFFIGGIWALGLAHHLFAVRLEVAWWTLPLVCGLTVLLALGAAVFPVRIVRAIQPAVVLKGE
jgi:putative ABC transport system permease protein